MTTDEIRKLEPGPEIDALVAERVMGWVPWLEQRGPYQHVVWQQPGEQEPYRGRQDWQSHIHRYRTMVVDEIDWHEMIVCQVGRIGEGRSGFAPSRDIADAWRVVDRMRELGFGHFFAHPVKSEQPSAGFHRETGSGAIITEPTMSEAICKAALLALREGE